MCLCAPGGCCRPGRVMSTTVISALDRRQLGVGSQSEGGLGGLTRHNGLNLLEDRGLDSDRLLPSDVSHGGGSPEGNRCAADMPQVNMASASKSSQGSTLRPTSGLRSENPNFW